MIVMAAFVFLFAVLGFLLRSGRGAFLIAGYNTMSKAEKEKIDEKKLCRYMGNLMFLLAGCQMFFVFSILFSNMTLMWVGMASLLACVIGAVIFLNTGKRIYK